jgi:hypothetical protein
MSRCRRSTQRRQLGEEEIGVAATVQLVTVLELAHLAACGAAPRPEIVADAAKRGVITQAAKEDAAVGLTPSPAKPVPSKKMLPRYCWCRPAY